QRMRNLQRLARGKVVDPQISRSSRPVVVIEQPLPVRTERGMPAPRFVHAFRDWKNGRLSRRQIMQVDVFVSVDIGTERNALAVGRELASANLPLVFGEPLDPASLNSSPFAHDRRREEADVVVPVRRVGSDQDSRKAVYGRRGNIVCKIKLLPLVRREQYTFGAFDIGDEDVRI